MNIMRLFVLSVLLFVSGTAALAAERDELTLGSNWHFYLGDPAGAESASFHDEAWRLVDVPHDWAMEGPYALDGAQGAEGGYRRGGVGWYRREFEVPATWSDRQVRVEFDAVYMNSEVWLNGQKLGRRPYGYISFGYDLTAHLHVGRNVLAVRVDNSKEPSARWYHGCGIYAPVRIIASGAVRIAPWGVQVTTPRIEPTSAWVLAKTELLNAAEFTVEARIVTTLLNPSGEKVAMVENDLSISGHGSASTEQTLIAPKPIRWDLATPHRYTIVSEVVSKGRTTDSVRTRFGIREIKWDAETGFWLNGRNMKLCGVAEHLEGGPVGAAWPEKLMRWKLLLLRQMGCNVIRTAHNPQVPQFYDLCDELGLLVMDEIFDGWGKKAAQDYGAQAFADWWERDLRDWVRRDRNHPSVVIWSVGNETHGAIASDLVHVCHELDSTRPVTGGAAEPTLMDVYGLNGGSEKQSFFASPPRGKPFVSTEAPHTWQVRGFYRTQSWFRDGFPNSAQSPFPLRNLTSDEIFTYDWMDPALRTNPKQVFNSSFDNSMVRITARRYWASVRDLPWISGAIRWTGWDYPGEASYVHGGWPFRAQMSGAIDLAGFEKDLFYFYQSQWTETPMVHLLPHWTHPRMSPGTLVPVWAYTNAEEVELFLDGRSLGRRRPGLEWNQMQCEWLVPWQPGTLEAVAWRDGREVARTMERTSASPARLAVNSDNVALAADGHDVAIVTVAQTDADGTPYPYGENRVAFHLEGPARIISLENGNPVDTEPNLGVTTRRTFFGLTRTFLQATNEMGDVAVTIGAICGERRQLSSDRISIDVQCVALRGPVLSRKTEIFYTLDGSEPTTSSTRYSGTFAIKPVTTVRALVHENGHPVFTLAETFGPDEGLYWPTRTASAEAIPAHGPSR